MSLDFTFGIGLEFGDPPPPPILTMSSTMITELPLSKGLIRRTRNNIWETPPTIITHTRQKNPTTFPKIKINLTVPMEEIRIHNQW